MAPLERGLYGQFFGGDSYVILYTYLVNNKESWIIYFWQGQVHLLGGQGGANNSGSFVVGPQKRVSFGAEIVFELALLGGCLHLVFLEVSGDGSY